jgi:hypothetical protein
MATINDFGIPGVGTGILQPKLKHKWKVTFANIGGGADSQPLSMQAVTVTRPSLSFEEVQLDRYNSRAWVAGKHTFEPMTITFEDDISGTATQVLQDQLQNQQFIIGAEGPFLAAAGEGSLYKFVTYLDLLDGNEQIIEEWVVEGCWLQVVDYTDLDYATSDAVQITCTVRYDHARQSIGGYDQGEGVATGGAGRTDRAGI